MRLFHQLRLLVLAAALAAPLAACSQPEATTTSPETTVEISASSSAPTTAVPTTVSSAEITALLSAEVERWMTATGAPGLSLAAILPDGSDIELAFGLADLTTQAPAVTTDFWRFGSVTKPMTSAVILLLTEQGRIDLDAPVTTYLGDDWAKGYIFDGVDYGPLLTVRQLLNHTNGFAEYAFDPGFFFEVSSRIDTPITPQEIIQWAVTRGPAYAPGTSYRYNTVGHVAAGLVIEAVTGTPAHQVFRELLFEPAGASSIYLPPGEFPPRMVASGYAGSELRAAFSFLPGLAPLIAEATIGDLLDVTALPQGVLTSAPFTGGGIEAHALEVARVLRALFSGQILSAASIDEFATLVSGENYGLGITVTDIDGIRVYSHGGGVPGFRSHALTIPELGLTLAISTNLLPVSPDIGVLADELLAVLRTHL
jgi:D-alanyl-D-alanine carboxypeptidase